MLTSKTGQSAEAPGTGPMSLGTFAGRLLVILVMGALAGAVWQLSDILILLFGAILLSIGLCAAARLIARYAHMPRSVALVGVFLLGLGLFVARALGVRLDHRRPAGRRDPGRPNGFKLFVAWMDHPTRRNCSSRCAASI